MKNYQLSILTILFMLSTLTIHAQKGFSTIFPSTKTLKAQPKNYNLDDLSKPYIMQYADGVLYFCNVFTSPLLTALHWETMEWIGEFGNKGQGPNEYLGFNTISTIGNQVAVYDNNKSEYIRIKVKENNTFTHNKVKIVKDGICSPFKVYALTEHNMLATGVIKNHRFAIYDDKGKVVTTFGEYPKDNIDKNDKDAANAFAYQSHITYNNSKQILAAGLFQGEGLIFYDMSDIHHPKVIKEHLYRLPAYTDHSNDNSKSVIFKRNSTFGFLTLAATEKYCIGLFSGNNAKNWKAKKLLIFDWNGTPIKEIKLSQEYEYMTASENEIILFGTDNETYDYVIHTIKLSDL